MLKVIYITHICRIPDIELASTAMGGWIDLQQEE
jgi:hypothetical protein